ncbi:MAG: pilin [Candidatus Yanofskybacteria bacterium]|nr:pilin [Candidatus Yanofskybacteria bacterium]
MKLRCQGSGTFDATENVVGGTEHTFARTCNYPTAGGYTVTVSGTRGGVSDSNYTTVRASSSSAPTTGTGGFFDCPQPEGGGIKICNPLQADSFTDLIDNILGFIFMIASALVPLMVVLAGFLFVTGGGNPDKIKQAKNILLWTVIGFTIILLSGGLVALLQNILGT